MNMDFIAAYVYNPGDYSDDEALALARERDIDENNQFLLSLENW